METQASLSTLHFASAQPDIQKMYCKVSQSSLLFLLFRAEPDLRVRQVTE